MADSSLEVQVQLSERSYCIEIGTGCLQRLGQSLINTQTVSQVLLISDEVVARHYAVAAQQSLESQNIKVTTLIVPAGETSKSIETLTTLWNQSLAAGIDRKSMVIALGGGVIGDLAGFVAASFTRGLDFFQVPTTLLAQVDSSVGGKVGINLPEAKNMVGAFWQPKGVLIDTHVLETLSDREYRAGLAEVVKYGVIMDEEFFSFLENHTAEINQRDPKTLRQIIAKCCRLKADVVEEDERETTGKRAILNYGHTFAHAYEAVCGYGTLLHGEAVAIGMLCASTLSEYLERIPAEVTNRQHKLLQLLKLPLNFPQVDTSALTQAMLKDKKVEYGKLRFVLPSCLGHVELVHEVPMELASSAIDHWAKGS